jgi:hypothetical protein
MSGKESSEKLLHKGHNYTMTLIVIVLIIGLIAYCVDPGTKEVTMPVITGLLGFLAGGKKP